jgi:hypothetical protein
MKFAESAGLRCALVLATLATVGALVVARPHAAAARRSAVTPYHGCGAGHRVARVETPVPPPPEDPYVVTLRSASDALQVCMAKHPDVQVRLAINISPSGRVSNVEVKTLTDNLSHVDLHMVKCVETAVSSLEFPATGEAERISTFLKN